MSISIFSLLDKVTLRLLKQYFNIADAAEWSRALDIKAKLQYINGLSSNPVKRWKKIQLKDLFGLIFRRIYIYVWKYIYIYTCEN
jgi:hypothetical protein